MPHGGTDLAASFNKIDEVLGRFDDPAKGGRLPHRPSGGKLATAGRIGRRRPETGPRTDRSPAIRVRSSSTSGKSGVENRAVTDLKLNAPDRHGGQSDPGPCRAS